MKLLTGLVLVQLVLLCALFLRVLDFESAVLATSSHEPPTPALDARPSPTPAARTTASTGLPDEERLRTIIRDELRSELAGIRLGANSAEANEPQPDPQMDIEYDYRRDAVEQSLDYYSQVGRISEAEMARLQSDIAKLRPADRSAMLGRLVRELNSGTLEGRL